MASRREPSTSTSMPSGNGSNDNGNSNDDETIQAPPPVHLQRQSSYGTFEPAETPLRSSSSSQPSIASPSRSRSPSPPPLRSRPARRERATSQSGGSALTRVHTSHLDDLGVYHDVYTWAGELRSQRDADEEEEEAEEEEREGYGYDDGHEELSGRDEERVSRQISSRTAVSRRSGRSVRGDELRSSSSKDPNLVTWAGPDDPENPKNWGRRRKWMATTVVSLFTFLSPLSSSMVAPALPAIAADLHISPASGPLAQMVLSVFLAAYMVGPLFLGPLSEIFGRVRVLQLANLFFLVFNAACGAATTEGQMIAFRFLAGLGGSAPLAIGGGVLGDAWRAHERGAAISVYSLMPLLGPAIGPIVGGFVTAHTTWRWIFYALSIAAVLVQVMGLFLLQETYPPLLLQQKAARLRKLTGNDALYTVHDRRKKNDDGNGNGRGGGFASVVGTAFVRPFRLLFTQLIIQMLALYMAFLYGIMYLLLSTFASLWTDVYGLPVEIAGLHYIALGIGFFLGAQVCAPLNDRIYVRLAARRHGIGRPEFRIPLMFGASVLVPLGIFLYGWAAQYRLFWLVPDVGAAVFAAGMIVCFQCIQTYLVDAYARYAASAMAAVATARSLCGFAFPLFAPAMYARLGFGWGNSLLGFLALLVGVPAPILLWLHGKRLREKSPFAAGGD